MKKPTSPFAHGVLDYATSAHRGGGMLDFPPPALAGGYTGSPITSRRASSFRA
ncbi:MAG TPA: hypothetical protein VE913_12360 [Longimicrobium sp.]|nr:hypothetical protein [Longimicrobium sp.]